MHFDENRAPALARRATRALMIVIALGAATLAGIFGCTKRGATQPFVLPPLSAVVIDITVDTLAAGNPKTFTATALDTNGTPVPGATFSWMSTNTSVFTVSNLGRVVPLAEGTAQLIVSAGGKSDAATITVIPGNGWFVQQSNTNSNLNAVYFQFGGQRGWAAGSAGRVVHTTNAGATWVNQNTNTTFDLNGIWFVSSNEGWAVGANGVVRHTLDGGQTWSVVVTGVASETLHDVFFANPDTGWAVGVSGVIIRTTDGGQTWTRRTPTANTLRSVSFWTAQHGWAVGDNGTIVGTHNAGATWFTVTPAVTAQTLNAVWRRSEASAWAAGLLGVSPRTVAGADSTEWTLGSAGGNSQLYGVFYPTSSIGYAVGIDGAGLVLRTDDGGSSWQFQTSNTQFRLNDVYFVDSMRGWAVGNNGAIVHTATGGLTN